MIDIKTIRKKIEHGLSNKEEAAFEEWLNENPKHRLFFKNALNYHNNGSKYNQKPADPLKAWEKVHSGINRPGNIKYRWITVAAIAAGIAGILYFLGNTIEKKAEPAIPVAVTQPIEPGSNKAVLIMDDGSIHKLERDHAIALTEGNSIIESTGDKLTYTSSGGDYIKEQENIKYNKIQIPRGGEFFVQLSDGTRVWLNSGSSLHYPVQFPSGERRVELTGEAFFEVTANATAPFFVVSGSQVIKALGTAFNISSYVEDNVISTTLVSGKVEVYLQGEKESLLTLYPNEQSCISQKGDIMYKQEVDVLPYIAWKDGRFIFRDQALPDIMQTLSRWYDVEVVFADSGKKNIRFTGNIERYKSFEDILEKIEKTDEVHFVVENKKVTIK